jgi:hypothetical protein
MNFFTGLTKHVLSLYNLHLEMLMIYRQELHAQVQKSLSALNTAIDNTLRVERTAASCRSQMVVKGGSFKTCV